MEKPALLVQLQRIFGFARLTLLRSQFSRVIEQSKYYVLEEHAANIVNFSEITKKLEEKDRKLHKTPILCNDNYHYLTHPSRLK